ncbi:hypothetical protein BD560DRAFT_87160 [Blakeslea trispora]|nr:hypothetical protein BD560DRAFT_87160 [Blakeslea trispora]
MTDQLYLQKPASSEQKVSQYNAVLVIIDTSQQPLELQDGLAKIMRHVPYKNLVSENAMDDDENSSVEYRWHVSFIHDTDLREGHYSSTSNYNNYHDIVNGDQRFEIQIRYNRKIDGKRVPNSANQINKLMSRLIQYAFMFFFFYVISFQSTRVYIG